MRLRKIYVMGEPANGIMKVGITYDTAQRLRNIRYSYPANVELLWEQEVGKIARSVEAAAHRTLADRRIIGEWFRVSLDEAIAAIELALRAGTEYEHRPGDKKSHRIPEGSHMWVDGVPMRVGYINRGARSEITYTPLYETRG